MRAHLAPEYAAALDHLLDALPPPLDGCEQVSLGWEYWCFCQFVQDHGRHDFDRSMPALREMTRRFSAEFAVRPFIARYPERSMALLRAWAQDADPHVRRLASEGSRPRLPWGERLTALQADPGPALPILEALKDDPEEYVRRSVANHLNDLSKDHPEAVVAIAGRWLDGASRDRQRLVRHALRTLIKRGHPGALAALGYGPARVALEALEVSPTAAALGGKVQLTLRLRSTADAAQTLLIDYAVHHVKADGSRSPKVFKWTARSLPAGGALTLTRWHSLKRVTTRRYYPGLHLVEVQINGRSMGRAEFTLSVT
jgi:3-methyladenine DNA glycosylase AlkC